MGFARPSPPLLLHRVTTQRHNLRLPSEIFPVRVRATGHGIAAAMGRLGGFIGVFTFPFLMRWHGLLTAESGAAIVSVLGLITTALLLPETKGKSLEELSSEPSTAVRRAEGA